MAIICKFVLNTLCFTGKPKLNLSTCIILSPNCGICSVQVLALTLMRVILETSLTKYRTLHHHRFIENQNRPVIGRYIVVQEMHASHSIITSNTS